MSETANAAEDRLYGLMEIAERQQAAVQAALDGLAAERAALAQEREALARGVQNLKYGMQGAVRSAVTDSLAGAASEGVAAVHAATEPLLSELAGVTAEAGQAQAALRQVVLWASWRLLGYVAAAVTGLLLMAWLIDGGMLWWSAHETGLAVARTTALQGEVAELEANRDALVRAGVLQRITQCGPLARPCLRVDESAGSFESQGHADYRVIRGY